MRAAILFLLALAAQPAFARPVVDASAPRDIAVTVYRDEDRGGGAIDADFAGGFAMISETRTVMLPPGESTIRFAGVAESMVAVSAIVTGLPGGTIEKNRNADLLSPAALVDGTLGNRVTITRTDPATGAARSESAIVRTRADGGLVLQTGEGIEAVRCAGLPERLTFDRVPDGLSAQPVFTVDTRDANGGTYTVTLTYLATGFDWQANYVATFANASRKKDRRLRLMAWLTVANANGQSFPDAELLTVAGRINVTSDYDSLSEPPRAEPLRLTCFPMGSSATGVTPSVPLPAPPPMAAQGMMSDSIVVTAMRRSEAMEMAAPQMKAGEEALGDLKLYRVPVAVTVAAKSQKQVMFLDQPEMRGRMVHVGRCEPGGDLQSQAGLTMRAENIERLGLGRSLPQGRIAVFEPSVHGPLLVAEDDMRDFAVGEEVEIVVADASSAIVACAIAQPVEGAAEDNPWQVMSAQIVNPTGAPISFELKLGSAGDSELRKTSRRIEWHRGEQVMRIEVPARSSRTLRWQQRRAAV